MSRFRLLHVIFLGALFLVATFAGAATAGEGIAWENWGTKAFERARAENKMIFVDVGTEWCSACNTMSDTSYKTPEVHALLKKHFVSIHVDAEAEPDIGERYGFWGWPALVFMNPKGEHVHFVRGNMVPKDFIWLLNLLGERFENGKLKQVDFKIDLARKSVDAPLVKMITMARSAMDRFYDRDNGGWGRPKMPFHDHVQQALWRGHTSDPVWKERAIKTAQQNAKLLDPIWGGVFFGAASPAWTNLIHERRTEHQASAIFNFAEAYAASGDDKWLRHTESVIGLLDKSFRTADGVYFTSQEMRVEGSNVSPHAYFAKSDAERQAIGLPRIDTTVYADINAKLAMALARLYEASRDKKHLERALAIGNQLRAAHTQEGWVRQILKPSKDNPGRLRDLAKTVNEHTYLRAQAFSGLAYLRLYRVTGDAKWFDAANELGAAMNSTLWYEPDENAADADTGAAFLGSSREVTLPNGQKVSDRPLVDNAAAAEFLLRLAAYGNGKLEKTTLDLYQSRAETALRSTSDAELVSDNGQFIGQYVLALHALKDEFIEVSVVCADLEVKECKSLHSQALHDVNHVRKLVKLETPGRYPDTGEPSAFVCTSKVCSNPLAASDPDISNQMSAFMARLDGIARDAEKR